MSRLPSIRAANVYGEVNDELARFAALVAAKERGACAQVCESTVWTASIPEWRDMTKHDIAVKSMLACAAAIRARGTKEGV